MTLKTVKETLVKIKIVFDRGKNYISYITFFMMTFVTITAMKEYEMFSFLSSTLWFTIVFSISIFSIGFIGWLEMKGLKTWQKEREIYGRLDPVFEKLYNNQNKILAHLKKDEQKDEQKN